MDHLKKNYNESEAIAANKRIRERQEEAAYKVKLKLRLQKEFGIDRTATINMSKQELEGLIKSKGGQFKLLF